MFTWHFFLAAIIIAIGISSIQWLFIGFLFHKYQANTPATWRKESNRSYMASMVVAFLFALLFSVIFTFWKDNHGAVTGFDALKFSALLWLTFSLTAEIGNAIYINYSVGFTAGKCVSTFFEYLVAGQVCVWLLT